MEQVLSKNASQPTPTEGSVHRFLLIPKESRFDPIGRRVSESARRFGLPDGATCLACKLFFLEGDLKPQELEDLATEILLNPVLERFALHHESDHFVDVSLLPGVTDTEAENLVSAAHRKGFSGVVRASRATRYLFHCEQTIDHNLLRDFAGHKLANVVIERFAVDKPVQAPFISYTQKQPEPEELPLSGLAGSSLEAVSKDYKLALDLTEMEAIRNHYQKLERAPTRCELETLAQTWSEHCVHKTFRAEIDYLADGKRRTIKGLLPILRQATEELNLDWVVSAFVDNAGIVKFDDRWNLAIKAETHNHPSALEPFGGANTGVGGVIRDILGVSARPFANWDVLCFGPLDQEAPEGSLPPDQVMTGVVEGIADYGNKMGIPTVAGGVYFHEGYLANPLVYCGCLGMLPSGERPVEVSDGDRIVVIGGKTGRDGLGGATFSSLEMDKTTAEECGTAVQIGNPIAEKVAGELLLEAFQQGLYSAVTDCGAGGLASAIGEMGEELGAVVHLERVPTKYPGLTPRELWLSEAQERMVLSVPANKWDDLRELAAYYDTTCVDLGHFGNEGRLQLLYKNTLFCDISTDFLHGGLPQRKLRAVWEPTAVEELEVEVEPHQALLELLSDPNLCSREAILRHYDFEVQGGTSVKPLNTRKGPSDGVALVPLEVQAQDNPPAVALACGLNPWLTELEPRLGTLIAMDEAIRSVVAVGADPTRISLLDNYSWGNPKLPDRLGKLTRSVLACAEGSKLYRAPFVSGKDSLNNEFLEADGSRRAIPGTILISAVGVVPKVSLRVGSHFRNPGDEIYLLGPGENRLGGSAYLRHFGGASSELPQPYAKAPQMYAAYHCAVKHGLVKSCHDVSEGGLAVALAESCLGGGLGAQVKVREEELFSEGFSRLLVTVAAKNSEDFCDRMNGFPLRLLGRVTEGTDLVMNGVATWSVAELRQAHFSHPFDSLTHPQEKAEPSPSATFVGVPAKVSCKPKVAILKAPGINREQDALRAVHLAGGEASVLDPRRENGLNLESYAMVLLPGGFSHGDDLGAGRLWALSLEEHLQQLRQFADGGGAILGICNGFQALLRTGLLLEEGEKATLAPNISDQFECRWVDLVVNEQCDSLFTNGLHGTLRCPVAHGEGRFVCEEQHLQAFQSNNRFPLSYHRSDYPANPNGSLGQTASLCNRAGNILGLMPHPENNIFDWQCDPHEPAPTTGLALFRNALRNLKL